MTSRLLLFVIAICATTPVSAADTLTIDDESFGVLYENPMNSDKGLILYISNNKCVGTYRIANHDLVIANGEINARGPEKRIHLGVSKFRVECGPLQALQLIRE